MPGPRLAPALLLCALSAVSFAQDFETIRVETRPLAEGIHLIRSRAGGNSLAAVGPRGVLLVDSDYEELGSKVEAAVRGLGAGPVRLLVNTHWHFDHVGGNERFARAGALVVAHENVRERMGRGQLITIIDTEVPASPPAALPVLIYGEGLTLHLGDETVELMHPGPAHTDGDTVVRFRRANVVHTGDLVFAGGYPFIDLSSGGGIEGLIAALETVLGLCDEKTVIVPGHGELMKRSDLRDYVAMLRSARDAVAAEVAAGKSLEEAVAARPTAALDERWGKTMFPPPVFTEILYRSLSGS
jgi:glyoxylase-like metal-dependent hydrolase (beta-lactamase superfamily II)